MKLKHGPYSPSRLDTAICGYSFYHQYVDPNRSKDRTENLPQGRGSAVHEIFECITAKRLEAMPNEPTFSSAEISKWTTEAITRHPVAFQEVDDVMDMVQKYIRRPPANLTKDAGIELKLAIKPARNPDGSMVMYMDTESLFTYHGENIPVERIRFEECNYDDKEAWARGRADILVISDDFTKAIVYDHKTQMNVEEADTFQMGFYAWVISQLYPGLSEIMTVLHFAKFGSYSEPYLWRKSDLYQIEQQFLARAEIVEARTEWTPIPHKNCQYCNFRTSCPSVSKYFVVDPEGKSRVAPNSEFRILGDQQRAVDIAGFVTVMEEALKVAKKELREFCDQGSSVAIPGRVYEFRADEEIHWDKLNTKLKKEFMETFTKHGVDPVLFMGFSQKFSKGVWLLENETLLKELSALAPRKTSVEFGGHKA